MTPEELKHYAVLIAAAQIQNGTYSNKYEITRSSIELAKLISEEVDKDQKWKAA